jgi:hypothetical protein
MALVLQKLAPKHAPNFAQKVSLILRITGPQFGRNWNQNWPPIVHRNDPKIGGESKLRAQTGPQFALKVTPDMAQRSPNFGFNW